MSTLYFISWRRGSSSAKTKDSLAIASLLLPSFLTFFGFGLVLGTWKFYLELKGYTIFILFLNWNHAVILLEYSTVTNLISKLWSWKIGPVLGANLWPKLRCGWKALVFLIFHLNIHLSSSENENTQTHFVQVIPTWLKQRKKMFPYEQYDGAPSSTTNHPNIPIASHL